MRIVIEVEASPRVKRALRGLLVATAIAASGVAVATPQTFIKNEPLSAAKMNDNFQDLDGRLVALEEQSEPGVLRLGEQQIVYGVATSGGSGYFTVLFPKPFLTDDYTIVATAGEAGVAGGSAQISPIDKTKAIVQFNGQGAGHPIHWMAIGRWK